MEAIPVGSSQNLTGIVAERYLEFVEDAIVLIQLTKSRPEVLVYRKSVERPCLHVDVP